MLILLLVAGCATHADRLREIRSTFYSGGVETAIIQLDKYTSSYSGEAEVFKLDRAVVELAAGRPREAEKILREVRDRLDYNSQTSVAEKAGSLLLTDDTHTAYAGEDYEKVLVRALLALSNLMSGGEDAKAYALQVSALQEQIIAAGGDESGKNPKQNYKRIALGAYLQGMLQESSPMEIADAARSWVKVCSWEPDFPFGRGDVDRAQHGHHSRQGNGVLYVFALVGRGPYKVEVVEPASTVSMFLASAVVSATSKQSLPPAAPIKVPKVIVYRNLYNNVQVSADGQPLGPTATITDVGQLAAQQYEAIYPRVVTKAVFRRAAKQGMLYAAKEGLKMERNSWANLAVDVGGFIWQATESADCRCWGLLPDRIQVLRVELPAGDHRIGLRADGGLSGAEKAVHIADGRNTYLMANFADGHLIGNVLVSDGR